MFFKIYALYMLYDFISNIFRIFGHTTLYFVWVPLAVMKYRSNSRQWNIFKKIVILVLRWKKSNSCCTCVPQSKWFCDLILMMTANKAPKIHLLSTWYWILKLTFWKRVEWIYKFHFLKLEISKYIISLPFLDPIQIPRSSSEQHGDEIILIPFRILTVLNPPRLPTNKIVILRFYSHNITALKKKYILILWLNCCNVMTLFS